jgi:molybdopterin synthase catalytic subunit
MAISICRVAITDAPLHQRPREWRSDAGAVVEFYGVVRALEDGREIDGIQYEVHRAMAQHQLELVAERAAAEYQLSEVVIDHRVGFVPAGEPSLFLRVSSPRRKAAFEASESVVEELKKTVPIWKCPVFSARGGTAPETEILRGALPLQVS